MTKTATRRRETESPKYRVGSRITYRTFTGASRTIIVEHVDADIKDGLPGFDGVTATGDAVWGYATDVVRVEKF